MLSKLNNKMLTSLLSSMQIYFNFHVVLMTCSSFKNIQLRPITFMYKQFYDFTGTLHNLTNNIM